MVVNVDYSPLNWPWRYEKDRKSSGKPYTNTPVLSKKFHVCFLVIAFSNTDFWRLELTLAGK